MGCSRMNLRLVTALKMYGSIYPPSFEYYKKYDLFFYLTFFTIQEEYMSCIPVELQESLKRGECVLFVGSKNV